jgi:hypothetical protein
VRKLKSFWCWLLSRDASTAVYTEFDFDLVIWKLQDLWIRSLRRIEVYLFLQEAKLERAVRTGRRNEIIAARMALDKVDAEGKALVCRCATDAKSNRFIAGYSRASRLPLAFVSLMIAILFLWLAPADRFSPNAEDEFASSAYEYSIRSVPGRPGAKSVDLDSIEQKGLVKMVQSARGQVNSGFKATASTFEGTKISPSRAARFENKGFK